tara:strand:+ start:2230 stop:2355 length:126 start_codon:yes stop_codon:yes gene_type:complete
MNNKDLILFDFLKMNRNSANEHRKVFMIFNLKKNQKNTFNL